MPKWLCAFLVSFALPVSLVAVPASSGRQLSSVTAALSRGDAFSKQQDYEHALEAYRQADTLADHACPDCYMGIANAELMLGDLPGAVQDFGRAAETAGDDRVLAAEAHMIRGQVLSAMASDPADTKLKQAEKEFRTALSVSPKKSQARFYLGVLLLGENRDSEGVAELKAYISGPFVNPKYEDRAKRLIADPSRARLPQSEDFSFTTLEGDKISRDGLRGDVVLLDFWGSWCPPCRQSVPMLSDLHQKFAGKSFQMVGISSDDNERTWREFIAAHQMNWPEYIDLDGRVLAIFENTAFPTFVVLDRDGGIQFRQSGLGADTETELETAINGALRRPFTGNASTKEEKTSVNSAAASTAPAASEAAPSNDMAVDAAHWQASLLPLAAALAVTRPSDATTPLKGGARFAFPPDDVDNGDADAGVYRNEFLGLLYRLPQSWIADNPEQLEQENSQILQWTTDRASGTQSPVPVPKVVLEAKPDPRAKLPFVRITVQPAESLTLDLVHNDADELKQRYGLTIQAAPQQTVTGKHTFFRTTFQSASEQGSIWIASIETVSNHCRVTLEIYAGSKPELDSLVATAQTLTISRP